MKYTNKYNFPDYVQQWLKFDEYDYDPDTISATTLLQPPRAYALQVQNYDNLEIDFSDIIPSRYGTAIHDSIEKVKLNNCIQEKRLRTLIDEMVVTGKFDIMKEITKGVFKLVDVKSTSVWTFIYGSKDEEYIKQLSIYRYLGHMNGYNVLQNAEIFMIFTDWSNARAKEDEKYPQTRIKIVDLKLWDINKTRNYIKERVKLLTNTANMEQKDMPKCTDEELWAKETKWAVLQRGKKVAIRLCDSKLEADKLVKERLGMCVEERKGMAKRCKYCSARKFCDQYAGMVISGKCEKDV